MKVATTSHVFSNNATEWAISGILYLAFFFFFIWYHAVRDLPFALFATEKCTAIASVCCLALTLALGPLSHFFSGVDPLLPYRRSLGLTAAFMSIPHVLLVWIYLPLKFPKQYSADYPLSWFVAHWFTIAMGALTLVLFLMIALYSFPGGLHKLGERKWMILQKFAYLVMVMVVLHLLSMGKIPKNWIAWFQTHDKPLPPGSLPTMAICLAPLLFKAVDLVLHGDSLALKPDGADANEAKVTPDPQRYAQV